MYNLPEHRIVPVQMRRSAFQHVGFFLLRRKLDAFAGSEAGIQVFGEEKAKQVVAHAQEIKADGAVYCDCPACMAVAAILEKKEELLQN